MSILKFKNADGTWNGIAAFKGEPGRDGAIQYQAGFGINISEDNVISSTLDPENDLTVDANPTEGSVNPVSSGGVYTALAGKADTTYVDDSIANIDTGDNVDPYTYYMTGGISNVSFSKGYRVSLGTAMRAELGEILTDAYAKSKRRIRLGMLLNYTPTIFETGINSSVPNITSKPSKISFNAMVKTNTPYETDTTSDYLRDFNDMLLALTVDITWSDDNVATISSGEIRAVTGSQSIMSVTYYNKHFLPRNNTESYTPTSNYHPATKKYVDDTVNAGVAGIPGPDMSNYPTLSQVLIKGNTEEYTPELDYEPAPKKYVDDAVAAMDNNIYVLNLSNTVINGSRFSVTDPTDKQTIVDFMEYCNNNDIQQPNIRIRTKVLNNTYTMLSPILTTGDRIMSGNVWFYAWEPLTGNSYKVYTFQIYGTWTDGAFNFSRADYTDTGISNKKILLQDNTTAYTPTADYHPATKKYVDDTVAESGSGGITEETDPTVPVWVKSITEDDITNWNNKLTSSDLPSDLGDLTNNAGYTTATDVLNTIHVNADLRVLINFSSYTDSYYTNLSTENITFENFNKDALDSLIKQGLVKLIDEGYDPNKYPDSYMLPIKTFSIQTYIPITVHFNKVIVDKTDETGHNEVYESNINDPYLQDYTRYIASRMFGIISSMYIECYTQDLTGREIDSVMIEFNVSNVASSAGPTPGGRIQLRFNGNYISDSNITLGELTHMWPLTDTSLAGNQTTDIQFSLNSIGHYLLMISGKQESDIHDSEYYETTFKLTLDHYMGYSIAEFIKHHRRFGFTNTSLGVSISNFLAADNYHTKVNALLNFDGLSRPASNESVLYIQYMGNVLVGKDPLKYTSLRLILTVDSDTYELLEVSFRYDYPLTKAFEPYYTAGYDSSKTQTLKNVEGTLTWVDD